MLTEDENIVEIKFAVQYRLSGPDIAKVRDLSQSLAAIVRPNPHLSGVVFDWMEPARVVKELIA